MTFQLTGSVEEEDISLKVVEVNKAASGQQSGLCIECGYIIVIIFRDQPSRVFCEQCQDDFCKVCFQAIHRKGNRAKHTSVELRRKDGKKLDGDKKMDIEEEDLPKDIADVQREFVEESQQLTQEELEVNIVSKERVGYGYFGRFKDIKFKNPFQSGVRDTEEQKAAQKKGLFMLTGYNRHHFGPYVKDSFLLEKSKYFPLRLTLKERKIMRLVCAASDVSEYTDKIDIITWKSKNKRIFAELKEMCGIMSGLAVASSFKVGQKLIKDKDFKEYDAWFQRCFEIARRHKIRNPEKMRASYGKLIHMLMDAAQDEIKDMMEFTPISKVETVYSFLEKYDMTNILRDDLELLLDATSFLSFEGASRKEIDTLLAIQNDKFKQLVNKHLKSEKAEEKGLSRDSLELCFRSISDANCWLFFNRDPIEQMISWLKKYFDPTKPGKRSLQLHPGQGGARLAHSHKAQYYYVLQSMTLWLEIMNNMYQLWYLAEEDLISGEPYRLRNTGQGLNRIQACPRVGKALRSILHKVHQQAGEWVGSSVVHLGDHNVPNALAFIDKYNQVPRIVNPIVLCIKALPRKYESSRAMKRYIDEMFGGLEGATLAILTDFFKHAFDGSGADNFFDAGSCIDGRLTSAWNWCQKISKKDFHTLFLMTGFVGFDGKWA